MTPVEMVHKRRCMELSVDVERRQGMRSVVLLRIDVSRLHVLDDGWDWWVHVVVVTVNIVLLLFERRRSHHNRPLLHHQNLLGDDIVADLLRLVAKRFTHIHPTQMALIVNMKVEVCRKFKLIW